MNEKIDYAHWSDEYEANAARIQTAIDKRKQKIRDCKLSADQKKTLLNEIGVLRAIRREQLDSASRLRHYIRRTDETTEASAEPRRRVKRQHSVV